MPRKNRSNPIVSIAYDENGTLYVDFADGSNYTYSGVPMLVYLAFKAASSQGSYFNANIRNHY